MGTGAVLVFGPLLWLGLRMADWRNPHDEDEFERVVGRSEELAAAGVEDEPPEEHWLDPYDDDDFEEIVRDALDELPPELRRADRAQQRRGDDLRRRRRAGTPTASTTATAWPATTCPTGS